MIDVNFDLVAALVAVDCPRCGTVGLMESDDKAHDGAPSADRHVT